MSLQTELAAAVAMATADANLKREIIQGPASGAGSDVTTLGGVVPTLAKRLAAGFWGTPVPWVTAAAYQKLPPVNLVIKDGEVYACAIDHTSGTFATDLAAGKLVKLTDFGSHITDFGARAAMLADMRAVETGTFKNYLADATVNKAINEAGEFVTSTGRYATDFIEVTRTMKITRFGNDVPDGGFVPIAFYNDARVCIGFTYAVGSHSVFIYDLANSPAGTKFVRGTGTNATIELYIYDQKQLDQRRDEIFSTFGLPEDRAGQLTEQYIHKNTGALANSGAFRLTPELPVTDDSYLCCKGSLISNTTASQAQFAFFGTPKTVTVSISSPAVFATTEPHGYSAGHMVLLSNTVDPPALPTGAVVNTQYFVIAAGLTATEFQLSATLGGSAINTSGTQSGVHSVRRFFGSYNPKAVGQSLRVRDHFPGATSVRVTMNSDAGGVGAVNVLTTNAGAASSLALLSTALEVDFFAENLENGRLTFSGTLTQTTPDSEWRTTTYIPTKPGMRLRLTCNAVTALGAVVAGFTANKSLHSTNSVVLKGATNQNFLNEDVVVPAGVYNVRATFKATAMSPTPHLYGARIVPYTPPADENASGIVYFAPKEIFAQYNEDNFVHTAGIVPDRSVPVAWAPTPGAFQVFQGVSTLRFRRNIDTEYLTLAAMAADDEQADNAICHVIEDGQYYRWTGSAWVLSALAETNIKISAMNGTALVDIATIPVRFVNAATAVSPTKKWNLLAIGNSVISQHSTDPEATDGNGTIINEVLRRLTGTGDSALAVAAAGVNSINTGSDWGVVVEADIPPPLGLTNFIPRGTRGGGTVKHEGRGGWHASSYLERDNTQTLKISTSFVSGNSISGEITYGGVTKTVGAAFSTNSDTTLAALAADVQAKLREFGTGTNPPTAVVKDADEITIAPKWPATFANFVVTGGASQPVVSFPGDGKFNPFWKSSLATIGPAGTDWRYSMRQYVETYGYDIATDATNGIAVDGNNLFAMFELIWNPYGAGTDAQIAAGHMAAIVDQTHREYSQATVWLLGVWPPPVDILKGNTGSVERWYEAVRVFRDSVREYGTAYRAMCDSPDRLGKVEFVDLAHVFDPLMGYSQTSMPTNRRANDTSLWRRGMGDFVHPRRRGSAFIADEIVNRILYKLCRGV